MEMVTAIQMVEDVENVNAQLIMSMHKTAPIMDVSTCRKPQCFILLSYCTSIYGVEECIYYLVTLLFEEK